MLRFFSNAAKETNAKPKASNTPTLPVNELPEEEAEGEDAEENVLPGQPSHAQTLAFLGLMAMEMSRMEARLQSVARFADRDSLIALDLLEEGDDVSVVDSMFQESALLKLEKFTPRTSTGGLAGSATIDVVAEIMKSYHEWRDSVLVAVTSYNQLTEEGRFMIAIFARVGWLDGFIIFLMPKHSQTPL